MDFSHIISTCAIPNATHNFNTETTRAFKQPACTYHIVLTIDAAKCFLQNHRIFLSCFFIFHEPYHNGVTAYVTLPVYLATDILSFCVRGIIGKTVTDDGKMILLVVFGRVSIISFNQLRARVTRLIKSRATKASDWRIESQCFGAGKKGLQHALARENTIVPFGRQAHLQFVNCCRRVVCF